MKLLTIRVLFLMHEIMIARMACLLSVAAVVIVFFSACSSHNNLIKDGHSSYKIFVSKEAIAPEKYAARELQTYLYKISGCKLEIVHHVNKEGNTVYIGFKDAPSSVIGNLKSSDFGNEEYIIRSDGKDLLIAGGETRGTLYGVMGYLSDHLGCRWYTKKVSKIPSEPTIPLPEIEDRQKPAFSYRDMDWRETMDTFWVVHNRVNGFKVADSLGGSYITYPFVHTFYQLVPPEKYFKSHPEYFSLVDGKRTGENGQLDLTNPEVVKIATATVFRWIKTHPKANIFSIDQNDNQNYCECEKCMALDKKEGSHSGSLLAFVNQIADSVAKVYPDVKLQTLAYQYTVNPPKHIRPADNVMIRLCHIDYCAVHSMTDCPVNKPFMKLVTDWYRIADGRLTIWDYYTSFRKYLMPFPNFAPLIHDPKFYAAHGVKGFFPEANYTSNGSAFAFLKSWVTGQLMWNPDRDGQKLINEFVDYVYGPAAPYIAAYITLLRDQIKPDTHLGIFAELSDAFYLNKNIIYKADSLFKLAEHVAAGNQALMDRVQRDYLPILYTKLAYFPQGSMAYTDKKELPAALSEFRQSLEKFHVTALAEHGSAGTIKGFLDEINLAAKSDFYTKWWVVGPFDDANNEGLHKTYPPEEGFDSTQTFIGVNGREIKWKKYADSSLGYVDFKKLFGDSANVLAYARKVISLPEDRTIKFGVGNNDGIRIWINGTVMFDRATAAIGPNQYFFKAKLNKGPNTILVKVDQLGHGWGFYFTRIDQ